MDNKISNCHNASVHEVDGKMVCDVCSQPCEVHEAGQTAAAAPAPTGEPKPQPGDKCTLPDGSEGIIAPDGVCVPVTPADAMPKVGDACEIDGKPGVFEQGADGLVCVPKEPAQ